MQLRAAATVLSLSIFLSACATYPQNREDQAAYHASKAAELITKGDSANAANQINDALNSTKGDTKIRELFARHPNGQSYYRSFLEKMIANVSSPGRAVEQVKSSQGLNLLRFSLRVKLATFL